MPLDELSAMATTNGAKALGLDVGRIEEGALADMLIIDIENYNFISPGLIKPIFFISKWIPSAIMAGAMK